MLLKKTNKKGLSTVLMMVIALALVVSLGAIIMNTTRDTVEEKTEQVNSCGTNLIGKLSLNSEWTCYDSTKQVVNIQIERKDIDLEKLTVSVKTDKTAYNFELNETPSKLSSNGATLDSYNLNGQKNNEKISLLEKNSAKNYLAFGINKKPSSIEIAPTINGNQCKVVDKITQFPSCSKIGIL